MTIIRVTLKIEDYISKHTHGYRSGRSEEIETHIKTILNDSIQVEADECDWGCECRDDSSKKYNDKVLSEINDMVNNSYFTEYNLEKIRKLIQKNIYAQIQAILDDSEMEEESKFYNIRDIVNDDIPTIDPEKESKYMEGSDYEDGKSGKSIDLIQNHPFVVEFVEVAEEKEDGSDKIIRTYEATMHIPNDFDHSVIYITMTKYKNGMSCGCSPTTIDHELPVQLSLTRPINRNDYLEYDAFSAYIKNSYSGKYEYSYDLSSK